MNEKFEAVDRCRKCCYFIFDFKQKKNAIIFIKENETIETPKHTMKQENNNNND